MAAAGSPPRRKCHDPLLAIVEAQDEKHHSSASLVTLDTGPQLAGNPQLALNCNATSSAVVSIFTPPATNSYVFSIMPLGASRIKQKAHPLGGQLHAWLAAAASPRLRDGFREPILQIAGSSQAEADAWDPRFPIPCGFFVFLSAYFRFAFPDGAPLSLWLISAVKPQNPEGWTRRPRLETTALATSTARISSCAHKVIVALIGKAIPRRRGLVGWSLISLGSRHRDFATPLHFAASTKESPLLATERCMYMYASARHELLLYRHSPLGSNQSP